MKENDVHMVTNKFRNTFVKEIIQSWFDYSYYNPSNIDSIRCQVIWFNSHIKVNNCTIFNKLMYDCNELRVIWPIPHEILSVITRSTIIT